MDDETQPDEADAPEPPTFDKDAARRRYRATMRSPLMRALYGMVVRQSMVLSFEKVFLLSGILFMAVLPLLWFQQQPV